MDITVKRTHKTFYQVDSAAAVLLLEAFPSEFERVEKPAPAPRPTGPQWGIGRMMDRVNITLHLPSGETRIYVGPPDTAADGFKYWQWSGEKQARVFDGPVPPAAIVEQYKAAYVPPAPHNM